MMPSPGDGRLFAIGLGLAFLAAAITLLIRRWRFKRRARSVDAIVRTLEEERPEPRGQGGVRYRAVFHYVTWNGEAIEARQDKATRSPQYVVGEHVRILYDPEHPTRMLAPGSRIAEPVLTVAGLLFIVLAIVL